MASLPANTKVYITQGGDQLVIKAGSTIKAPPFQLGTSTLPLKLNTYDDHVMDIYSTCASTDASNNVRPFYMKSTMTGAGGVGGRAEFHLYTNVALGGWSNAGKFLAEYGASGKTAGLGTAVCGEIQLSAGTNAGTYAALEGEVTCPTGAVTGGSTSFLYLNATGAGIATFDTNGYLFKIGSGITPAAGKFVSADSHTIKCQVEENTRYMVLSQSENGLGIGVSGTPVSFTQGSPLLHVYSTCASVHASNSVESFYCETTMTGAGGVGGRGRFYMTTNVALGDWSNALKSHVVYGASGKTAGLGSSFCSELQLSAGTTTGTYSAIEGELVLGTGAKTGKATSFMYFNTSGADASTFDTYGYLFEIGAGITPAAGKFVSANNQTIKCKVEETTRYMVLSQTENGLGIGLTGTPVSFTQGSPPVNLYTTCASVHASNSVESMRVETTMTGAGGVGGRALFYMTTNVALGDWSNALKAQVVYGAAGKTTGLGSAFCSEITMSAGTVAGHYAAIEAEINAPAACSTGTATSFLYVNGTDGSGLLNSSAYLFQIGPIFASGAANMWYDHQGGAPANVEEWVKVKTPAGDRWLALYNAVV
jgi:hypothetical protein